MSSSATLMQVNDIVGFHVIKIAGPICKEGRSGVDRESSSDARGPGFEPQLLHLKKYHFFTQNQAALWR